MASTSSRRTAGSRASAWPRTCPSNGDTVLRSAFGIYYDQPLVGIFEQNSFTMPPVVNNVTFTNATLANPASGQTADHHRRPHHHGDGDRLREPAHDAVERRRDASVLTNWLIAEASYVGSRGDNLIRPTDINYPDPARVVALQTRPWPAR